MTSSRLALRGLLGATAVAAVLAGCSGGSSGGAGAASTSAAPATSPAAGTARQGAAGFAPAAQGEIADISGTTLQVQSSTEQTAVTYTAKTTFTDELATSRSAVQVGSCVIATAAGSATSSASTSLTATTVRITATKATSCTGGFGGARPTAFPSGVRPSGFPTRVRPSGSRTGFPTNAAGRGFGAAVTGKVTAVSGSTITVQALTRAGSASSGGTARSVLVTSKTTYLTTATATAAALQVGLCANVQGSTNSSGAVTATRIALSPKSGGTCTAMRFPGGPNG